MVINWDQGGNSEEPPPEKRILAAEYVRMSTEHQKYSTDNQSAAIRRYADKRGYEIVQTYADEGKSGLRLDGRDALKKLLHDVESGHAPFTVILVYDVSRWGRFQDPDEAAAIELRCKRAGLSDEQMLELLKSILDRRGELSGLIIDEDEQCSSSSSFRTRFGSLLRAYTLVGFDPDHDYSYLEISRALRRLHPAIVDEVVDGIRCAGGEIVRDEATDLLIINQEFTASVVVVRCSATGAGSLRWKIRLDTSLKPDLTVAVRMDAENAHALDYYLLPRLDMHEAVLRLCEFNGLSLDAYRFDTLDALYQMATRVPMRRAA